VSLQIFLLSYLLTYLLRPHELTTGVFSYYISRWTMMLTRVDGCK